MHNNGDKMKALVLTTHTRSTSVEDVPRPIPKPGEVLIRVKAIALNPVDQIYVSTPIATQEKRVIGTDFAGVVVEASPELGGSSNPRAKPGTRVAGFLQGGEFRVGKLDEWIPRHLAA
jgi:NADPH:quinone reductase-like Zn-dependent oxidoreductase